MIRTQLAGAKHTVENSSPLLKKCPHCNRTVLGSGLTCPYCYEPLSGASRWQKDKASLFEKLRACGPSGAGKKILLASILVFLLLAVSSLTLLSYSLLSPGKTDDGDDKTGDDKKKDEIAGDGTEEKVEPPWVTNNMSLLVAKSKPRISLRVAPAFGYI